MRRSPAWTQTHTKDIIVCAGGRVLAIDVNLSCPFLPISPSLLFAAE